jgi:hypothetical protein
MLIQGEFYGTPDAHGLLRPDHSKMVEGRPDFVVFNGRINRYDIGHPVPIKVGELVTSWGRYSVLSTAVAIHVTLFTTSRAMR